MSDDTLDVDAATAELYREPPEAFVAGRDALAKALRAAKRRDEAAAVGKLRRPSRVAWAFNAALAGDAALGARLDDAVAAVTAAQEGSGSVRTANAALRDVVGDLVDAAARTSAAAGHDLDRSTLTPSALAVVGEAEALAALQAGRLGDVPAGGGFGFGLELPDEPAERPARRGRAATGRRPARARTPERGEATAGGARAATATRRADTEADTEAGTSARASADSTAGARAQTAAGARATARIAAARRAVADAESGEAAAGEAVEEAEATLAETRERVGAADAERAGAEQALAEAQERLAQAKRHIADAHRDHREAEKAASKARARREKAAAVADAARAELADLDG